MASLGTTLSRTLQAATNPILGFIGAMALGIFLGFLVLAFVAQNGLASLDTLGSILALLGGAAAFGFLAKLADADTPTGNIISAYLLGVLVGGVLFIFMTISGHPLLPGCNCPSPTPSPG